MFGTAFGCCIFIASTQRRCLESLLPGAPATTLHVCGKEGSEKPRSQTTWLLPHSTSDTTLQCRRVSRLELAYVGTVPTYCTAVHLGNRLFFRGSCQHGLSTRPDVVRDVLTPCVFTAFISEDQPTDHSNQVERSHELWFFCAVQFPSLEPVWDRQTDRRTRRVLRPIRLRHEIQLATSPCCVRLSWRFAVRHTECLVNRRVHY